MDELANLRFDQFLQRIAERQATPGGGSVAAAAGALSCALGQMVISYSTGPKTDAKHVEKLNASMTNLNRFEQITRALVTQDAVAYEAMTAAVAKRSDSQAAEQAYQEAVLAAVAVPMEIAAVSSRALTAMDELKEIASRYLLSDLAIAAILADATARSAWYLVQLNAHDLAGDDQRKAVLAEANETIGHCDVRLASIEAFVRDQLEIQPLGNR